MLYWHQAFQVVKGMASQDKIQNLKDRCSNKSIFLGSQAQTELRALWAKPKQGKVTLRQGVGFSVLELSP